MDKELFKEFLTNAITEKQNLLTANSISEEDKTLIQNQIENLQAMVEKVDALEGDGTAALVEELKNSVSDLTDKLTALNEKINQKNKEIDNDTQMNDEYLKSQNSVNDFVYAIRNSRNGEEFHKLWGEMLVKNDALADGINFEDGEEYAYLPDFVRGRIQDLWEKGAGWLADLRNTGAKKYVVRSNNSEKDAETSRAKGWKKGETKASQALIFGSKPIEPQFIYKLIDIDKMTEFQDDGSLLDYVLTELVNQLLSEERRAILVGDGRDVSDPYKINSFEALAKSASDAFTTVTEASADFLIDDIRTMVDTIENEMGRDVYLFLSKADFRALSRIQASSESSPVYLSDAQVAEMCGVSRIYKTDLVGGASNYKALAFIPSEYVLVGQNVMNPELTTQHNIYTNVTAYRVECPAGGGIEGLKSSAVLYSR